MPLNIAAELVGGAIARTIQNLVKRYPVTASWLVGVSVDRTAPAPVTVPGTRMIHFPPTALIEMERTCKNGLAEVAAHEFAHVLMLAAQLEAVDGDFTQLPNFSIEDLRGWRSRSRAERDYFFYNPPSLISECVESARKRGLSQRGFGEGYLNQYGAFDDLEFFAEVMRAYWTHEPTDEALSPMISAIGEAIDMRYQWPG